MRRILQILLLCFLLGLIILGGAILYLQTNAGQDFLGRQVASYLEKKLNTKVRIEHLRFSVPTWLGAEEILLHDKSHDTLFFAKNIHINLAMAQLLHQKLAIDQIESESIHLHLSRTVPDSVFNYEYIVNAFASPQPSSANSWTISLNKVRTHQLKFLFHDDFLGNDTWLQTKNTEATFDKFDIDRSIYYLSALRSEGLNIRNKSFFPLAKLKLPPPPSKDTLALALNKLQLSNLNWQVASQESGIESQGIAQFFAAEIDKIYLESKLLKIKNVFFNTANVNIKQVKQVPENVRNTPQKAWIIASENNKVKGVTIQYDVANKPFAMQGLDYNHLLIKNFKFDLANLNINNNEINGVLKQASLTEKSGLVLQDFQMDFRYGDKETTLKNIILKTQNSSLKSNLLLQYKSKNTLTTDLAHVFIKAKITPSQLAIQDILRLAPDLTTIAIFKQNNNNILKFDGELQGKINNFDFRQTHFNGLGISNFDGEGNITGLPTLSKLVFSLKLNNFAAKKNDLLKLLPQNLSAQNIHLPEHIKLSGWAKGNRNNLNLNAAIISELGKVAYKGSVNNRNNIIKYDGIVAFEAFDMGTFLQMPDRIGKISLETTIKGQGFDPKTAQASVNGTVKEAYINGYHYHNLSLSGDIANQLADFKANLADENAHIQMNTQINFASSLPAIQSKMQIENINFKKLNLYPDSLAIKGKIALNLSSADVTNPIGNIEIIDAIIDNGGNPIKIKNSNLIFQNINNQKKITIDAPFMQATAFGNFEYSQLKNMVFSEINKYFALPDSSFRAISQPYDFWASGSIKYDPIIKVFVPKLNNLESSKFDIKMNNQRDSSWQFNATIPYMQYDSTKIKAINISSFVDDKSLRYKIQMDKINDFGHTTLAGDVANNLIRLKAYMLDSLMESEYAFAGDLSSDNNTFRLKLQENVQLNYQNWRVDSTGYVQFGKNGIIINKLLIEQKNQRLAVNSTTPEFNSPIRIEATNLRFPTLLQLIQQDTLLADGILNGDFLVRDFQTKALFTGTANIKNLVFREVAIGDLNLKSYNESSSNIITKASLKNDKNDILLSGVYDINASNPFDFDLTVNKLDGATIQAFSLGQLKDTKGALMGQLKIKGNAANPYLTGDLVFDNASFRPTKLGSKLNINQEKLHFKGQNILLKNFVIKDSTGQKLLVNGKIDISNFKAVNYDFNVITKDFMALNSLANENDFYFGKGYFDSNINIKGIMNAATIDGTVRLRNPSQITIVMPNDAAQKESSAGVVMFVNKNGDEIQAKEAVAVNTDSALSTEISMNIESDKEAEMIIVIDPLNGDNIKLKGNAQLTTGWTDQGQNYIFGSYDIIEGTYDLTYQLLKKGFKIQKGSNIVWTGDLMQGAMNITATYDVDASPYDLVANDNPVNPEEYKKKMPFTVLLKMNGILSNPQISFNLKLNSQKNILVSSDVLEKVKIKLDALRGSNDTLSNNNNNADLNKQVFGLLLTNGFIPDQPSNFFSNLNAEAIARQSVSKLLSDQLNQLARNLIKGVKLDLNLNSTSINAQGQTNLMVGLSKGFLDNKLTVSVGRNFGLENSTDVSRNPTEIFDNVSLNYNLSDDGRYLFRVYRKNEYMAILDGIVISTGLSFRYTIEFDKLKEMLQNNKNK